MKNILQYTEVPKKSAGSVDEILHRHVSNAKVTSLVNI